MALIFDERAGLKFSLVDDAPPKEAGDFVGRLFSADKETALPDGGPVESSDAAYIRSLYLSVLGREPEPEGLAYWVTDLQVGHGDGPKTRAEVLAAFQSSPEAKSLTPAAAATAAAYSKVSGGGANVVRWIFWGAVIYAGYRFLKR